MTIQVPIHEKTQRIGRKHLHARDLQILSFLGVLDRERVNYPLSCAEFLRVSTASTQRLVAEMPLSVAFLLAIEGISPRITCQTGLGAYRSDRAWGSRSSVGQRGNRTRWSSTLVSKAIPTVSTLGIAILIFSATRPDLFPTLTPTS